MALKTILEVEIDDSKFRKFRELFDAYNRQLAKVPGAWKEVNKETAQNRTLMDKLIQAAADQNINSGKQANNAKQMEASIRGSSRLWVETAGSAATVEKYVTSITSKLAKWSTLTAVFTGLLGAGSLFGLDRLASAISTNRKSAMGLGVSYGQQSAFNVNYSRFINPGSFLNNVAGAKYDMTSPAYRALMSMGISPNEIQKKNSADLSQEALERLPGLFAGMKDRSMIGAKAKAYGVDQLMTLQELMAYLNASPQERKATSERYRNDARSMDMSDETTRKWQDFTTQLDRAGRRIQTVFMDKLVALEQPLEKLSDTVVHLVDTLANSGVLSQWISSVSGGLEHLADFINSPDFKKDVKGFGDFLANAVKVIWKFVSTFGGKVGDVVGKSMDAATDEKYKDANYVPLEPAYGASARGPSSSPVVTNHGASTAAATAGEPPPVSGGTRAKALWLKGKLQADFGLTDEQAAGAVGWMMYESRLSPTIVRRGGTDTGYAQWVGPRRDRLLAHGPLTDESNYAQIHDELTTNYAGALSRLKSTTNLEDATHVWGQFYQGAGGTPLGMDEEYRRHLPFARRAYQDFQSNGPQPTVTVQPNTGGNPHTGAFMTSRNSAPGSAN